MGKFIVNKDGVGTYGEDGVIPAQFAGTQLQDYRDRVSGADIALGNISFAIYPFFPFSYRWQLGERQSGGGTVFRPDVKFDPEYMQRIANFKRLAEQGPMYQGGTRAQGFGRVSDPTVTGGDIYERSWSGQLADPSQQPARDEELLNIQAAREGESDTEWVRRMENMNFDMSRDTGAAGFKLGAQTMMEDVPRGPAHRDSLMGEGVTSITGVAKVSALADKIVKDVWEGSVVQGSLINAESEVGREIYRPFGQEGYKSFTPADKGYVGELASEAMASEDNLIQALEAAGGNFTPHHFPHLYLQGDEKLALQETLGRQNKYLDKNRSSDQSTRNLEVVLASLKQLGVDSALLSRTVGGEETIDVASKEMIRAFGTARNQIVSEMRAAFPQEEPVVDLKMIATRTAMNLENQINTLLTGTQQQIMTAFDLNNSRGRAALRRMATPGKVTIGGQTQAAPPNIAQGLKGKIRDAAVDHWWGDTGPGGNRSIVDLQMSAGGRTFDGMISQLGHYWRTSSKKPVQVHPATKATQGVGEIRPMAEARQILTRFRSMAVAQDVINSLNISQEGTAYFMQTPITEGYQSFMFIEFLNVNTIRDDFIPRNLRVRVHPYIIPVPARTGVGLESVLHAAAIDALTANHSACVQFEQRRNELTKAFGLMIAMDQGEWDSFSGRSLHNFSNDMVSNPMMTVIGPGVQGGYLTPQSFLQIMKQDLRRVIGTGSALNTGIANAIRVAHTKTNVATDLWKSGVITSFREKTGLSNRQSEQMLWKASAGIWSPFGQDAMTDFKGMGVAAAPIFGFHSATDQQMNEIQNTIRDMDLQDERWKKVGSDLRKLLGTGNEAASSLGW